ncbi:MAG: AAA family ATPase [Thermoplasmata archaeon]
MDEVKVSEKDDNKTKSTEGKNESVAGILNELSKYFVGDRKVLEKILAAILASGHVLLQDDPGTGKTFLAKLLAQVLGLSYHRIQFTPDLLPSDIIGTKVWRQAKSEFEVIRGPIFANLILADEINRAPPKTQAALLEAMEERQVTIEGETIKLPLPFIVIATQNPIEFEGTYPLPEAQMDRFMVELSLGHPQSEKEVLKRRLSWQKDDPSREARTVTDNSKILEMQQSLETEVKVSDELLDYISAFAQCRKDSRVLSGPSTRGLISLLRMSRAFAYVQGRNYVIPDDVKAVYSISLSHRLILKPEFEMENLNPSTIIDDVAKKILVPK